MVGFTKDDIIYATPIGAARPEIISAKAGNGNVTITWGEIENAERYAVYIYENGIYTLLNSSVTDLAYTAAGLINGTKYGFKVKAYINGKWSAASSMAYASPKA